MWPESTMTRSTLALQGKMLTVSSKVTTHVTLAQHVRERNTVQ